jgi:hypothetical protein
MKNLKINGVDLGPLPEKWEEFTPKQVKYLCRLSLSAMTPSALKVQLFLLITGMSMVRRASLLDDDTEFFWMRSPKIGTKLISSRDIAFVIKTFDFLFKVDNDKVFIESGLVNNAFPVLRNRWGKRLYGPDGALFNITWEEFVRAETLYSRLGKESDAETVNQLLAVLYRKRTKDANPNHPDFKGDLRIPFNDHNLKQYARNTAWLAPWQKIYIRLFYDGCRAFIIKNNKYAFGGSGEGDELPQNPMKKFMMLSNALTGNDPTKTENLRKSLLWDVLPAMDQLAKDARALREKTGKNPKTY